MRISNFLYTVFSNIKTMFRRHTLILILLLTGLTVSSFALVSYYAYSTTIFQARNLLYGLDRSIEMYPKSADIEDALGKVTQFAAEKHLPLKYITAVSYDLLDMDMVGISGSFGMPMQKGELGKTGRAIVVSQELLKEGQAESIGKPFEAGGKSYTISGVMETDGYMPETVDNRRIPDETLAITNKTGGSTNEKPYREKKAGLIRMETFAEDGYGTDVIKLYFNAPFGNGERERLEKELLTAILPEDAYALPADIPDAEKGDQKAAFIEGMIPQAFAQYADASDVYAADYYSKLVIYLIMVVIGFINIISVYNYVLLANRDRAAVYRMCGGTRPALFLAMFAELAIYCTVTFAAGWLASGVFIANTTLAISTRPMMWTDFILLFSGNLLLATAATFRQLLAIVKNPVSTEMGWEN